jgi:hypothetical protein
MKQVLVSAMLIFSCYCNAQMTQVVDMEEILIHFNESKTMTWGIFDIDMVLVQPSEPAFQMPNMKRHSAVSKRIIEEIPQGKKELFLSLMSIGSEPILIDAKVPAFLKELSARGIFLMALTANLTGELASVKSMEDWRVQGLQHLGIDFSNTAPHKGAIAFPTLPLYRGNSPVYKEGILFANGTSCSKGEVLTAFIKKVGSHPQKIIFIDDREENLHSVETALYQLDPSIEYLGVHYLGAKQYPSPLVTEEEFIAKWKQLVQAALLLE